MAKLSGELTKEQKDYIAETARRHAESDLRIKSQYALNPLDDEDDEDDED